jgi:hypothetical protein
VGVREDADAEPEPLGDGAAELEGGDMVSVLVVQNMGVEGVDLEKKRGEDSAWNAGCSSVETITRSEKKKQWVE